MALADEHARARHPDSAPDDAAAAAGHSHQERVRMAADAATAGCSGTGVVLLFTSQTLDFLADYAHKYNSTAPEDMGAAVHLVVHVGGYRGRRCDHPAGHRTFWRGYGKLATATKGHLVCSK